MNEQPIQIIPSTTLDKRYVTRNFLGSNENLKGASLVGIEDASDNFAGTTVEAALVELANKATTPPFTLHTQLSGLNDDADNVHVTSAEKSAITHSNRTALDAVSGTNTGDVSITGQDFITRNGQALTVGKIDIDDLSATGTPSYKTFLRGDNIWMGENTSGWIETEVQPTYVASESNGRVYSVSMGSQYAYGITKGDRVRLENTISAFKYFIVHDITDGSGGTKILYLFGNETMTNSAITGFAYSHCKFPTGFPMDMSKWSISTQYATQTRTLSPVPFTWYNNGGSYAFPRGVWDIDIKSTSHLERGTSGWLSSQVALTTSATPSGSPEFEYLANKFAVNSGAGADQRVNHLNYRGFTVSSATTYYLCQRTYDAANVNLTLQQDNIPTVVTIVSSYL